MVLNPSLSSKEEIEKHIQVGFKLLEDCRVCPRNCHVNRTKAELGYCQAGKDIVVSSYNLHFGEEPELVGRGGSGTIFLTSCNLGCVFCQNYEISHLRQGEKVSQAEFVEIMLTLQKWGAHNINFVSPTHFTPQILEAIFLARKKGLNIPTVYNCGGYESVETLKLLEGMIDIYMPDAKFADAEVSKELCAVLDYPQKLWLALKEMHRQVGDLVINKEGLTVRGLLIRHLVLPDGLAGSEKILRFIAQEISPHTYVNIMNQYQPNPYTLFHPQLNRRISVSEYKQVIRIAKKEGLHRGFCH